MAKPASQNADAALDSRGQAPPDQAPGVISRLRTAWGAVLHGEGWPGTLQGVGCGVGLVLTLLGPVWGGPHPGWLGPALVFVGGLGAAALQRPRLAGVLAILGFAMVTVLGTPRLGTAVTMASVVGLPLMALLWLEGGLGMGLAVLLAVGSAGVLAGLTPTGLPLDALPWGIGLGCTALGVALEARRWHSAVVGRRMQAQLRAMIAENPEGVVAHEDGRIVFANQAFATFLGYDSPDALVGRSAWDLALRDHEEVARGFFATGDDPTPTMEWRSVRSDGGKVDLEWRSGPRIEHDGGWVPVVTVRDMTRRNQLSARVLMAERMASVGTLAAGVAHEINNPLSYIRANLEYALENLPEADSELRDALAEALEGSERVRMIVRDLKTFGRVDEVEEETADLHAVLELAINMAWNEIRHRSHLVRQYGPACQVRGSPSKLGQVFVNLLVNAAQSMPVGHASRGEISVHTEHTPAGAVVEIADTGAGIDHDVLKRIFEPFFTTKAVGEGTGLGLSICHNIVKSIGGSIAIDSERGEGTRVRIVLPMAEVPATALKPATPVDPAHYPEARILVVDDEPFVLRSLERSLHDFKVVAARSGREALDVLRDDQGFEAIVVDLMMPDISGIELYTELQHRYDALSHRVLFITGGVFTESAQAFLRRTSNPVLVKPFDRDQFLAALGTLRSEAVGIADPSRVRS